MSIYFDPNYPMSVGLDSVKLPRHVAIIMDGNGRWAEVRESPRFQGHLQGAETVRTIVTESSKLGLTQLTLYCFSAENWKRPKHEVDFLMALLEQYLQQERSMILDNNIRFTMIGQRDKLTKQVNAEIDKSIQQSEHNTGLTLCLAINYSSRNEIVDACRHIATRVMKGELTPEHIEEATFSESLYTCGMPDPDLLIRTAGEMRISNFLLWQISYTEIWVTPVCWPEFTIKDYHDALRTYAHRTRRYGGLTIETDHDTVTELC